jgi:hypothetical protein
VLLVLMTQERPRLPPATPKAISVISDHGFESQPHNPMPPEEQTSLRHIPGLLLMCAIVAAMLCYDTAIRLVQLVFRAKHWNAP